MSDIDGITYENEEWLPLLDHNGKSVKSGRHIYVRKDQQKIFTEIARASQTNFHQLYLNREILKLKSLGYIRSLINKFRPTDRVFELEGGKLVYSVDGKCNIYLKDILINGPFRTRGKNKIADDGGVYKVKLRGKDEWLADTDAVLTLTMRPLTARVKILMTPRVLCQTLSVKATVRTR